MKRNRPCFHRRSELGAGSNTIAISSTIQLCRNVDSTICVLYSTAISGGWVFRKRATSSGKTWKNKNEAKQQTIQIIFHSAVYMQESTSQQSKKRVFRSEFGKKSFARFACRRRSKKWPQIEWHSNRQCGWRFSASFSRFNRSPNDNSPSECDPFGVVIGSLLWLLVDDLDFGANVCASWMPKRGLFQRNARTCDSLWWLFGEWCWWFDE